MDFEAASQNLIRSTSLDDLKHRRKLTNLDTNLRDSNTDSMLQESEEGDGNSISRNLTMSSTFAKRDKSNDTLLHDLDTMLRYKLNFSSNSTDGVSKKGSSSSLSALSSTSIDENSPILKQRFVSSRNGSVGRNLNKLTTNDPEFIQETTEINNSGSDDDENDDQSATIEEEEDEEFANVDEIDGPITPNSLSPKGNDKLNRNKMFMNQTMNNETNDENIIDTNKNDILNDTTDYNIPVGEEFQRNLDRRASELLTEENRYKVNSRPKIEWELEDFYSLEYEIPGWFTSLDFVYLSQARNSFLKNIDDPQRFLKDDEFAKDTIIGNLAAKLSSSSLQEIASLMFISVGTFNFADSLNSHISLLRRNNFFLIDVLPFLIKYFKEQCIACRDDKSNLKRKTLLLFHISTIMFCLVSVCIDTRKSINNRKKNDDDNIAIKNKDLIDKAIQCFHDENILKFLTDYIEHWRWNSRLAMRIRNIILLFQKLLILQFGDITIYRVTKKKLYKYHGLNYHGDNNKKLTVSPLQYEAFREDITSRFPDFEMPRSGLPDPIDNSNSLSQFLEIPRAKSKSYANASLAVPEIHIATPAPSPPSSPIDSQFNDGFKPRKSFQTNMAYPYIYPSGDTQNDPLSDNLVPTTKEYSENDILVPFSIEEASNILSDSLEIKLSSKQLWYERDLFMETERGWIKNKQLNDNPYDYINIKNGKKKKELDEIKIMNRIENYYKDCLGSFNSLIFVLLQTIESNLSNVDYKANELLVDEEIKGIQPQLEIVRTKEILMRSCSGILTLLLKWFKLNHVLKYEHLALLIYDSRYINICTSILNKYSEIYQDKVLNKVLSPQTQFWEQCSKENASYMVSWEKKDNLSIKLDYNITVLSSFGYLLRILRKITGNKTHRLKSLPLAVDLLFKRYYRLFNLDIYHPILRIIREITPFKNKRWKSEHMDLISGVYLYEKLNLTDNWVTGKDIAGELNDAGGQEIAMRALLQFYNFKHYEEAMEQLGYAEKSPSQQELFSKNFESVNL